MNRFDQNKDIEAIHHPGLQPYKIDKVFAVVVQDEKGSEGVPAVIAGGQTMPMVFTNEAKVEDYRDLIRRTTETMPGMRVVLRTYTMAHEEVLVLNPGLSREEELAKGAAYVAQIQEMADRGRKWIKAHPEAVPKVQFNFPQDVAVITDLTTAREKGAIVFDGAGKKLVNAMCEGMIGTPTEPTPFMLKMALEIATTEEKEEP